MEEEERRSVRGGVGGFSFLPSARRSGDSLAQRMAILHSTARPFSPAKRLHGKTTTIVDETHDGDDYHVLFSVQMGYYRKRCTCLPRQRHRRHMNDAGRTDAVQ